MLKPLQSSTDNLVPSLLMPKFAVISLTSSECIWFWSVWLCLKPNDYSMCLDKCPGSCCPELEESRLDNKSLMFWSVFFCSLMWLCYGFMWEAVPARLSPVEVMAWAITRRDVYWLLSLDPLIIKRIVILGSNW